MRPSQLLQVARESIDRGCCGFYTARTQAAIALGLSRAQMDAADPYLDAAADWVISTGNRQAPFRWSTGLRMAAMDIAISAALSDEACR